MRVRVISSARLHLGFYNFWNTRAYGSIGVMIRHPRMVVEAEKAPGIEIKNMTGIPVEDEVRRVLEALDANNVRVVVREAIPRHIGLGSTTQLMLAVGKAVSVVKGLRLSVREIAASLGRGSVSGIGVAVFEKGGFVIDTGRRLTNGKLREVKSPRDLPGILFHSKLPRGWCFTVIVPETRRGLGEEEEKPILEKPLPHDEKLSCMLYETLLQMMIPAIIEQDPYMFGKALTKIQRLTGKYFSPTQGGTYCCRESQILAEYLGEHGALAVGQSSWGPTIYGFYEDPIKARRTLKQVLRQAKDSGIKVRMAYVALPRNRGAVSRNI